MDKIELMKQLQKAFAIKDTIDVRIIVADLYKAIEEQGEDGLTSDELTFFYGLKALLGV